MREQTDSNYGTGALELIMDIRETLQVQMPCPAGCCDVVLHKWLNIHHLGAAATDCSNTHTQHQHNSDTRH